MFRFLAAAAALWLAAVPALAQPKAKPKADLADVKYGPHERNVLDLWRAKADRPTALVVFIHGGGFQAGSKESVPAPLVIGLLAEGISVMSVNYRLSPGVAFPVHYLDCARAIQFARSKAKDWNIDPTRIGATGGSAGGCSSLWLAFHDDMADPKSADPVARESTRLHCAAVNGAQVTLDPKDVREWLPNYTYGAHAFGMKNLDEVEQNREKLGPWIKEYSPISHVTKDDPPIGLYYGGVKGAKVGESHPDPTHSPILGIKLAEKLKAAGVEVVFHSNTEPNEKFPTAASFLIDRLKK